MQRTGVWVLLSARRSPCSILLCAGSLSLDDVIRDLLFEPASLDDWLAPGKSWDDPPPPLTAASEPGQGRGRRGKFIGACMGRLLAVAAGALSG